MNLEKLGLLFLMNYFNRLSYVKKHLQSAAREVLLAMDLTLDIFSQANSNQSSLGVVSPLLSQARSALGFALKQVAPPKTLDEPPSEMIILKEHIVSSIISAIDEEIENAGSHSEKNRLKLEALETVRKVLLTQKDSSLKKPEVLKVRSDVFVA